MKRPDYLALDQQGFEITRKAQVIGELPVDARKAACVEATATIAAKLGLPALKPIPFGAPVFLAFELTLQQAKKHAEAKLLRTAGHELSLDYCPSYTSQS